MRIFRKAEDKKTEKKSRSANPEHSVGPSDQDSVRARAPLGMDHGRSDSAELRTHLSQPTMGAPKMAFIHIRKTAGTSFLDAVSANYSPEQRVLLDGRARKIAEALEVLSKLDKDRVAFVHGHVGFGLTEYLGPDFSVVTILRNPLERAVSQYFFLRSRKDSEDSYYRRHTLDYAIADPRVNHLFTNVQTRVLSSGNIRISDKPAAQLNESDLKAAVKNLGRFDVVGFTEDFSGMLEELSRRLGLRIHTTERAKVNAARPSVSELPDTTRRLLILANELDMELYDAARKRAR